MNPLQLLVPALCLGLGAACTSVDYEDPDKTETLTIEFGSTDLKTFSRHMVDEFAKAPGLTHMAGPGKEEDARVIAVFGGIANETREHINTDQISREIQSDLFRTFKFRWVAGDEATGQEEIAKQVRFQNSGVVSPEMAKQAISSARRSCSMARSPTSTRRRAAPSRASARSARTSITSST
jgi:PBP1b-binding outer membrane lipoprotein LpoB